MIFKKDSQTGTPHTELKNMSATKDETVLQEPDELIDYDENDGGEEKVDEEKAPKAKEVKK